MALKWMWNPRSPFWIKPRLSASLLRWGWLFNRAANPDHVRRAAPVLAELHLASRRMIDELAALPGPGFGFKKEGLLSLCRTQHGLDEESRIAEQARTLGIPAEVLDARATAALDPEVAMDIVGCVFFPLDCHLDPARFADTVRAEASRTGVVFDHGVEATAFRIRGRRIEAVLTSTGDREADEFVICGGAWSPALARSAGIRLPMQPGKGYSLTMDHPPRMPTRCSILTEARVAVTPLPGGRLRFGGTMEIAGLDRTVDPRRIRGIIDSVRRYFPQFRDADLESVRPWNGLRPCSADGLPYLGRFRAFENLSCATGHAMLGLTLGPITGHLMAQLLDGEIPDIPIRRLEPDRYS
jgi:D-amino-acid dehydrogenase